MATVIHVYYKGSFFLPEARFAIAADVPLLNYIVLKRKATFLVANRFGEY